MVRRRLTTRQKRLRSLRKARRVRRMGRRIRRMRRVRRRPAEPDIFAIGERAARVGIPIARRVGVAARRLVFPTEQERIMRERQKIERLELIERRKAIEQKRRSIKQERIARERRAREFVSPERIRAARQIRVGPPPSKDLGIPILRPKKKTELGKIAERLKIRVA